MRMYFSEVRKKVFSPDFQNNLWTLTAAAAGATFVTLMVLVTVRFVGLIEAGILSFAAAVTGLIQTLVIFGVRVHQATDIKQEFTLNTYLGLRICSSLLAIIVIYVFLIVGNIEMNYVKVIMSFFFIYLTDGFADVFMGDLQQKGKMRIAGRIRVCSFVLGFIMFTISLYAVRVINISLVVAGITVFVSYISCIWLYRKHFNRVRVRFDIKSIRKLSTTALPTVMFSFMFYYLYNTPKYFLGFLCSEKSVAITSMLIMPTTLLALVSTTLFMGAEMTKTAEILASGGLAVMKKRINLQLLVAIGLSITFILCVFLVGIPLLSIFYGVDLSEFRYEFKLLALGAASFPVIWSLAAAIVVLRMQKMNLVCTIIITVFSTPILWVLISRYSLVGAALTNLIVFVPFTILSYFVYIAGLRKAR